MPPEAKRGLIEPAPPQLSVARQCELVGLPRASFYYGAPEESAAHRHLMRLLDEQDTRSPFDGVRRMTAGVRAQGYAAPHQRVARLLPTRGLETLYSKPRTRQAQPGHRVYPDL